VFAEAGHIHNSYLEVLYNNGIVGLIPILAINIIITVNLGRVVRRPGSQEIRYYAAGALALFVHLQVWGLTAMTFGSTADLRFMTFLALLLLSEVLKSESACTLSGRNA
jgi:O-antigen ligase